MVVRREAIRLRHWGMVNGVSEELNTAPARAKNAAAHATDADLKADYEEAHAYAQAHIGDARHGQDEEDDKRLVDPPLRALSPDAFSAVTDGFWNLKSSTMRDV